MSKHLIQIMEKEVAKAEKLWEKKSKEYKEVLAAPSRIIELRKGMQDKIKKCTTLESKIKLVEDFSKEDDRLMRIAKKDLIKIMNVEIDLKIRLDNLKHELAGLKYGA